MFKKKDISVQNKFAERLLLFTQNINYPLLNNRTLGGE